MSTSAATARATMATVPAMGRAEWSMLLLLSLLWGGSFFFVGVAVAELPVLTIVAVRVGLAALALWAVLFALGLPLPRGRSVWVAFLVMGLLNNAIPFGLIVWGQTSIASGLAAILNAATPLFGVVVAGVLLADERITAPKLAGVAIGFAGVAVLVGPEAVAGLSGSVLAQCAILGAGLSYAFAGVWGRRFRAMGVSPVVTAAGQVTGSTVILAPAALIIDQPWTLAIPSVATLASAVALALLSTAFAYVLYFRILERAGAVNLLLVTFLVPVSAVLLGAVFLGEALMAMQIVGMALIGAGLGVLDGRLIARWRGRR